MKETERADDKAWMEANQHQQLFETADNAELTRQAKLARFYRFCLLFRIGIGGKLQ